MAEDEGDAYRVSILVKGSILDWMDWGPIKEVVMIRRKRVLLTAVLGVAVGLMPFVAYAADQNGQGRKDSIPIDSSKNPESHSDDRGKSGVNIGGQTSQPGEGEQSGRPGTIFGAPATLPPQDKALQYEGADKSKKSPSGGQ